MARYPATADIELGDEVEEDVELELELGELVLEVEEELEELEVLETSPAAVE